MKWWYGVFVAVGVALGGYFLRNYPKKMYPEKAAIFAPSRKKQSTEIKGQ